MDSEGKGKSGPGGRTAGDSGATTDLLGGTLPRHTIPLVVSQILTLEMGTFQGGRSHESLLRAGVSGYTWDQCWYDYRLGVVGQFNRRIKHDPFNSAVGVWTHDNCISAFEDYNAKNYSSDTLEIGNGLTLDGAGDIYW